MYLNFAYDAVYSGMLPFYCNQIAIACSQKVPLAVPVNLVARGRLGGETNMAVIQRRKHEPPLRSCF